MRAVTGKAARFVIYTHSTGAADFALSLCAFSISINLYVTC